MKAALVLASLALVALVNLPGAECGKKSNLIYVAKKLTFNDAEKACVEEFKKKGLVGSLASLVSDEDNALAATILEFNKSTRTVWIGNKFNKESKKFTFTAKGRGACKYSKWADGFPSDKEGEECVGLAKKADYAWVNADCGKKNGFFCQVNI